MAQEEDGSTGGKDAALFGSSRFKNRPPSFLLDLERSMVQFSCLFNKNLLILRRRRVMLLLLVLIPSLIVPVLVMGVAGAGEGGANNQDGALGPRPLPLTGMGPCNAANKGACVQIVYSPSKSTLDGQGPVVDGVMKRLAKAQGLTFGIDVVGFETRYALKDYVSTHLGSVQFAVFFVNQTLWTRNLWPDPASVSSFQTDVYPTGNGSTPLNYVIFHNDSQELANPDYRSQARGVNVPLLVLQKNLEESILGQKRQIWYSVAYAEITNYTPLKATKSTITNSATSNNATMCDAVTHNYGNLAQAAPWAFSLGLAVIGVMVFQLLTEERGKGLFTSLRRLGLLDSTYWLSWFLSFQIFLLLGTILAMAIAACLISRSIALQSMNFGVLFLILWLGGTCCVSNSIFLASICNQPSLNTVAVFMNFVMSIFTIALASVPLNHYETRSYFDIHDVPKVDCFLVGGSFEQVYSDGQTANGLVLFIVYFMPWFHISRAVFGVLSVTQYVGGYFGAAELFNNKIAMAYDNAETHPYTSPGVAGALTNLVTLSITYILLAWFFGQVLSSDAGEGRSILTVLLPASLYKAVFGGHVGEALFDGDVRGEERERSAKDKSVRAYKCSKTYSGVQALKEVTFSVRQGECFVLLGHNGAGKSTLINILTGVTRPTHGKAFLAGLDVDHEMAAIQQSIGVCAQDDLLWDDLTAREHMYIHAAFKGLRPGPDLTAAVNQVLTRVQLLQRADTAARNFSGGMKRRLSVAMSAVGEVDILFLDEPSTGLDPISRRCLWDMINWMKKGRVLVLTTHNMEEADYLGDSIMILHGGKVRALGDPLFLKQTYGTGMSIKLSVDQSLASQTMEIIQNYLPGSNFIGDWSTGALSLNVSPQDAPFLSRFFAWLETDPKALQVVREWGISNTTLEQVFLLLCVQNTEVNFVNDRAERNLSLCPLCRVNQRQTVILRSPSISGKLLLVPEAMCSACTTNEFFVVEEEEYSHLLQLDDAIQQQQQQQQQESLISLEETTASQRSSEQVQVGKKKQKKISFVVPLGSFPGQIIGVQLTDQIVTVTVPSNAKPGETIMVAIDKVREDSFAPVLKKEPVLTSLRHKRLEELLRAAQARAAEAHSNSRLNSAAFGPLSNGASSATEGDGTRGEDGRNEEEVRHVGGGGEGGGGGGGVGRIHVDENEKRSMSSLEERLGLKDAQINALWKNREQLPSEMRSLSSAALGSPASVEMTSAAGGANASTSTSMNMNMNVKRQDLHSQQQLQDEQGLPRTIISGSWNTQVRAIMRKNITLQSHQCCSNVCVAIFVAFMLLLIYLFGILFTIKAISACPQGWVTASTCEIHVLSDHIFSAGLAQLPGLFDVQRFDDTPISTSGALNDGGIDTGALSGNAPQALHDIMGPWEFTISHFIVPSTAVGKAYPGVTLHGTRKDKLGDYTSTAGLPAFMNRLPSVWSDLVNATTPTLFLYLGVDGLSMNIFPLPAPARSSTKSGKETSEDWPPSKADAYMMAKQKEVYELLQNNGIPGCELFAPQLLTNLSSFESKLVFPLGQYLPEIPIPSASQALASSFADAVFECPACQRLESYLLSTGPSSPANFDFEQGNTPLFFNGTLWTAHASLNTEYYKYFLSDVTVPVLSQQLLGYFCPENVQALVAGYYIGLIDQTRLAMTYLNLLSNSMADPLLQVYNVQGGVSSFGNLFFDYLFISQFQAFFLTIFTIIVLNSLWPLSVWRLSYERAAGITQMMKSVGMSSSAYLFGMYLFDTLVQFSLGFFTMVMAVNLELSSFKDAPLGYLVTTALLSAHALSGVGLLAVRLAPNSARLTSLIAACLSIGLSVVSTLIMLFFYRNDGEWPNGLSILPFFAQTRAIYLILVYHKTSSEVDIALGLLFFTGAVCLLLALIIDMDPLRAQAFADAISARFEKITKRKFKTLFSTFSSSSAPRKTKGTRGSIEMNSSMQSRQQRQQKLRGSGGSIEGGDRDSFEEEEEEDEEEGDSRQLQKAGHSTSSSTFQPSSQTGDNDDEDDDGGGGSLLVYAPTDSDVIREAELAAAFTEDRCHARPTAAPSTIANASDESSLPPPLAMVLQSLSHQFPSLGGQPGAFAIRSLSLALRFGETFGLLGPNGAGKSTTIGILTGLFDNTGGRVFLAGKDISQSRDAIHKLVGVCPQFDVCWDELSVEEHLDFQARQRGVSNRSIVGEVQRVAAAVGLDGDAFHTPAAKLSGGMRRRLSIGMCIVGDPPIIFLDEATSGLDPENRQTVWQVIQGLKRPDRLILLTTHSMEEAEALCSRVGILAGGALQCVGTPVHLKHKYGSGYTLTVNLHLSSATSSSSFSSSSLRQGGGGGGGGSVEVQADKDQRIVAEMDAFVRNEISNGQGELASAVNHTRRYNIPKHTSSVSLIFEKMEQHKQHLCVREWGIAQTSLEEVFLHAVTNAREGQLL